MSAPPSTTKPVAIRIQRPYETEAELLAAEGATLTRSTLLLLGAKNRPTGTVLRFELVLRSGTPVFRGEGKVVEYRQESEFGTPGLVVKFSRLDARSKKLLEELLGPQSIAPGSIAPGSIAPVSLAPASLSHVSVPELALPPASAGATAAATAALAQVPVHGPSTGRPIRYSAPVTAMHTNLHDERAPSSPLDRLRQRGRSLSDEKREAILSRRRGG